MADQREPSNPEEVIDLRELILIIWRVKWLILGVTLLVGILTFIISSTLVQEKYQATSLVTVTDRDIWVTLELRSLPQLAESDELRSLTLNSMGIADRESQRSYAFSADTDVRGQLLLEVTADDPDLAVEAANNWAGIVSERIITLYGASEDTLNSLEEEISQTWTRYEAAQKELENFLSKSNLEAYSVQLSTSQSALAETLMEIERNRLLISDIEILAEQIESMAPAETLNNGVALSIINLQVRATVVQEALPIQNQGDYSAFSLDEAAAFLQLFDAILENQNQQLAEAVTVLEDQISGLSYSLETEKSQEEQLRLDRNLVKGTYESLVADLEEGKILLGLENSPVKISARALPPDAPISPNVLTTTGFAAMSAALLAMLGSFFHVWWLGRDDS